MTHDGASATCRTLTTYIEHNGLLDDLDVRASDILQANCVIWVEGPSDRIYINHWISLFSEGQLKEGFHYQCVFYGGRLLSHLTANDPDRAEVDEAIKVFRLNRRAYLIMDSDKRNQQTSINPTKKRIQEEIQTQGGVAWITKGKEIENYLPADAVEEALELQNLQKWDQYDDVFAFIENAKCGVGEKMRKKKPLLAEKVISYIDTQNWRVFDLETKIQELCQAVRSWNQIREE